MSEMPPEPDVHSEGAGSQRGPDQAEATGEMAPEPDIAMPMEMVNEPELDE